MMNVNCSGSGPLLDATECFNWHSGFNSAERTGLGAEDEAGRTCRVRQHVSTQRVDAQRAPVIPEHSFTQRSAEDKEAEATRSQSEVSAGYAAFRVVVDYVHKDDVFEKVVWPLGTDVRDWVFTNRKHDGEQS